MTKYNPKRRFIQVLYFFVLILTACNSPFATREPEAPVSAQSSWIQPTSPTFVMINLRNAISEKNISNYIRCLADTGNSTRNFVFIADPAVGNINPGLFSRWSKDNELNYLNQLMLYLPKDSTSVLTFTTSREDTYQDSVILIQEYKLNIHYKCSDDECLTDLTGQVEFRMIKTEGDLWFIHRWQDNATGDTPTWSALKAKFGK